MSAPDYSNETIYQGKPFKFEIYKGSFSHIPVEKITQVYGCITDEDNHILIVHNTHGGWGLPGGSREEGETCLEALHREVYEESAVVLDPERITELFYQMPYSKVDGEWVVNTIQVRYRAYVKKKDAFISDPAGGVNDMKWVSYDEFGEYVKWGDTVPLLLKWMREH